ncbi:response regulator transcription factor [Salinirubellus sp. GCM10025818]|uniref:response regulator transcription factor n=2 Tax=Salinirubellus TaxID=2162630 RepID=UPI0030D47CC1
MMGSVLIADDDAEMRELLRFNLEKSYDVTTVTDGEECWNYLNAHADDPPDLVVLDVMMPGLDGYRVLDRVSEDDRFKGVDIIMLTSRGRDDDIVRALESGAADYLTKPFSSSELIIRIKGILS